MNRILRLALLAPMVLAAAPTPAPAQTRAADLRKDNTAFLQMHGQDRALVVRAPQLPERREDATALLVFCRQQGVTVLFLAFDATAAHRSPEIEFHWRGLLAEAHRAGLTIYALVGDAGWLADLGNAYNDLGGVLDLGARHAPGEQFDGVLVELPLLATLAGAGVSWSAKPSVSGQPAPPISQPTTTTTNPATAAGGQTPTPTETLADAPGKFADLSLVKAHLELIASLRRYLDLRDLNAHHPGALRLGLTLPAWLTVALAWQGHTAPVAAHLAAPCDFVVLHNLPNPTTDVGKSAETLMRALGRAGKRVWLRLELGLPERPEPSLLSLSQTDQEVLELTVEAIRKRHEAAAGFAGVVLDDYLSYLQLPDHRDAAAVARP
jgi:hypothetical protein